MGEPEPWEVDLVSVTSEQWIQDSLERLEGLEQERVELAAALDRAEQRRAALASSRDQAQARVDELAEDSDKLAPVRESLEARAAELAEQRRSVEERLATLQRTLDEVLRREEELERERERVDAREAAAAELAGGRERVERLDVELRDVGRTRDTLEEAVSALDDEIAGLYRLLQAAADEDAEAAANGGEEQGEVAAPAGELEIGETRPQSEEDQADIRRDQVVVSGVIEVSSLQAAAEPVSPATDATAGAVVSGELETDEAGSQPATLAPEPVEPAITAPFLLPRPDPLAEHPLRARAEPDAADEGQAANAETAPSTPVAVDIREAAEVARDVEDEVASEENAQEEGESSPSLDEANEDGDIDRSKLVLKPLPRPGVVDPVLPRPPTVSGAQ